MAQNKTEKPVENQLKEDSANIIAELKRQVAILSEQLSQARNELAQYKMFHEGVIVGQKIVLFDNQSKEK